MKKAMWAHAVALTVGLVIRSNEFDVPLTHFPNEPERTILITVRCPINFNANRKIYYLNAHTENVRREFFNVMASRKRVFRKSNQMYLCIAELSYANVDVTYLHTVEFWMVYAN